MTCSLVCSYVYRDSFQDPLDPPLITGRFKHTAVATLLALSRVNRLFHAEAIPYLYADVSIGLPASFEGFLGTVGVLQEEDDDRDGHIKQDDAASPTSSSSNCRPGRKSLPLYEERQGLLTPPSSRETSRDRGERTACGHCLQKSLTFRFVLFNRLSTTYKLLHANINNRSINTLSKYTIRHIMA